MLRRIQLGAEVESVPSPSSSTEKDTKMWTWTPLSDSKSTAVFYRPAKASFRNMAHSDRINPNYVSQALSSKDVTQPLFGHSQCKGAKWVCFSH